MRKIGLQDLQIGALGLLTTGSSTWEHVGLGRERLAVVAGKGGKSAYVNLTPTLVKTLAQIPPEQRTGFVLLARSR